MAGGGKVLSLFSGSVILFFSLISPVCLYSFVFATSHSYQNHPWATLGICTKPGEGQECRAFCRGFPDQMTSVTCLKGQSSLEWFVTNECPVFTTTTLDMDR